MAVSCYITFHKNNVLTEVLYVPNTYYHVSFQNQVSSASVPPASLVCTPTTLILMTVRNYKSHGGVTFNGIMLFQSLGKSVTRFRKGLMDCGSACMHTHRHKSWLVHPFFSPLIRKESTLKIFWPRCSLSKW